MKKTFYIPCVNLIHVKLDYDIKALCFNVTKGYFQVETLDEMYALLSSINSPTIQLVGSIDKVRLRNDEIVYRQRVFFTHIEHIFNVCKKNDISIATEHNFGLTATSYENIKKDEKFLDFYASLLDETLETWLIKCIKIYLYFYIKLKDLTEISDIGKEVMSYPIHENNGYLDRAPYFLSVCDTHNHIYHVFQQADLDDKKFYSPIKHKDATVVSCFNYGFNSKMVVEDKDKNIFTK